MNAFTRNNAPFYVDDLLAKICIQSLPIDQSAAQCFNEWQQREKSEGWFTRMSEASYDAWRKNGSHSYGL